MRKGILNSTKRLLVPITKKNPDNDSAPMGQTSLKSLPLDFFYKKNG